MSKNKSITQVSMSWCSYFREGAVLHARNVSKSPSWLAVCRYARENFNDVDIYRETASILPRNVFFDPHIDGFLKSAIEPKEGNPDKEITADEALAYAKRVEAHFAALAATNKKGDYHKVGLDDINTFIGERQYYVNGYLVDKCGDVELGGTYFAEEDEQARFERLLGCVVDNLEVPPTAKVFAK